MAWNDTLKDLLDQGVAVSKELASKAGEKAQDWGGKGLEASKDFASKAGAKIQELGEKGVLTVEIKQLESQAKKLIAQLGAQVCKSYEQSGSVSVEDPVISTTLKEIAQVKASIEQREATLKG
jgi:hypothetical protein